MLASPYETKLGRCGRYGYYVLCGLIFVFLVAPILAVVPISFSAGSLLVYPLPGLSLRWYELVLSSPIWSLALKNSLIIGSASTVLSTALGTLAALGLARANFPGKALVMAVLISPMVVPVVLVAVGVFFFYAQLGLAGSYLGLVLAHTALAAPFVVVTVSAALASLDNSLLRAAASLGAPPPTVFRRVTLPLILPGMVSGALFAFATSFDEVVVVLFLAGPEQVTLPRHMFAETRENINPSTMAVAALLIVLAVVLMVTMEALRRRSERLAATARKAG